MFYCALCLEQKPDEDFIHRVHGGWMRRCYSCRALKGKDIKAAEARRRDIKQHLKRVGYPFPNELFVPQIWPRNPNTFSSSPEVTGGVL